MKPVKLAFWCDWECVFASICATESRTRGGEEGLIITFRVTDSEFIRIHVNQV